MVKKIFATVGSTYPLDRMIKELDSVGKDKKYKIFAQIGESEYTPKNIEFTKFLTYTKMQSKIKWADLIISHAGAGSVIDLLTSNKNFILFPRLKKYSEAVDDHQLELCEAFEKRYGISYILKESGLEKNLNFRIKLIKKNKSKSLVNTIKKFIG